MFKNLKVFIFQLLTLFALWNPSLNCLASNLSRLDLTDDFKFDGSIDKSLKKHMKELKVEWLDQVKKDVRYLTRNHLKVGLYAYSEKDEKWDFFEDPNLYVSAWECTHRDDKAYSLGKIYNSKGYKDLESDDKNRLIKDFKARKIDISKEKDFPFQTYAHSEQAHISYLQQNDYNPDIYQKKKCKYENFLMIYFSTNDVCTSCGKAISSLLEKEHFSGLIYRFNGSKKKTIEAKTAMSGKTFNVFYVSLYPKYEKTNTVNLSGKDALFHTNTNTDKKKCIIF